MKIQAIQDGMVAMLQADEFFAATETRKAIEIYSERHGDVANKIATSLGKLGISVIVLTATGVILKRDNPTKPRLELKVTVQVQENVLINQSQNGTNVPALDVVEHLMQKYHQHIQPDQTSRYANKLVLAQVPFEMVSDAPILAYNVTFETEVPL